MQPKDSGGEYDLDNLLTDMEDHFSAPGSLQLHLGPGELVRQLHCAVKFSQEVPE